MNYELMTLVGQAEALRLNLADLLMQAEKLEMEIKKLVEEEAMK